MFTRNFRIFAKTRLIPKKINRFSSKKSTQMKTIIHDSVDLFILHINVRTWSKMSNFICSFSSTFEFLHKNARIESFIGIVTIIYKIRFSHSSQRERTIINN